MQHQKERGSSRILAGVVALIAAGFFTSCGTMSSESGSTGLATEAKTPVASTMDVIETGSEELIEEETEAVEEVARAWSRQAAEEVLQEILDGELAWAQAEVDVPEMFQYPELPTGCESVSLTIALNSLGMDLEKTVIADEYLIRGDDMALTFVGSPYSYDGAGIYPPGVVDTAERTIDGEGWGGELFAFNTSGTDLDDLYKLVEAGYPVLVWSTMYMDWPTFTGEGSEEDDIWYGWYHQEHCVVLCGYDLDAGTVRVSDPLEGMVTRDEEYFRDIFDTIGQLSVVVMSDPEGKDEAE